MPEHNAFMPAVFPDASPASIDQPSMRQAGRELLSLALMDARNHTLHLLSHFEPVPAAPPAGAHRPPAESPLWLAGHIGWLAEYWIGRNPQRALGAACPADGVRLASIEPLSDSWFNPALAPAGTRWQLPLPDVEAIRAYLLETLESTLELLEKAGDTDAGLYFYRMALFHEDLRCEQLVALAQVLGVPLKLALPVGVAARDAVLVPAGRWMLGAAPAGFAFGIERPAHEVDVPEFEIDAQPVSWAQYVEFVEDGGYDQPELWQPAGWEWLQREAGGEGRRGPRYVEQIGAAGGAVLQNHFGQAARMAGNQSVMHVSWWEADAWARWAGRRLPTEVEWEQACGPLPDPVEDYAWFASTAPAEKTQKVGTRKPNARGIHDMLGNAWEWVSDPWSAEDSTGVLKGGAYGSEEVSPETRQKYLDAWDERDAHRPRSTWWVYDGPFIGFRVAR